MSRNPADLAQYLLPFAEKEYISVKRAAEILGVSRNTVHWLHEEKVIEMVDYRKGAHKRVKYSSILELCDALRKKYGIADRRQPLSNPMFRHKDEDLLPFPLSDTIYMAEALSILGYESMEAVRSMIEEGLFEGYQLREGGPWRISRSSLAAFLQKVHAKGSRGEVTAVGVYHSATSAAPARG